MEEETGTWRDYVMLNAIITIIIIKALVWC